MCYSEIYVKELYVRVFKTREFTRWANKEKVLDKALIALIHEMEAGQNEVSLGGRIYKKRIALEGRGKRGGARVIVAYIANDRSFFIYGFSKNEIENITIKRLDALKKLAKQLISPDFRTFPQ